MFGEWNALGIVFSFLAVFLFARSLLYKCVQVALVYWRVPWKNAKGECMQGELPQLPYGHFHQVNFFGRPLSKMYGSIYYIWHCLTPVVIMADAEAIRTFYADHYSHQRDRDFTCLGSVFKDILGSCLATSYGREEVRRCRGPFEKFFSTSAVSNTHHVIGRECSTFLKGLPIGKPVDLQKEGLANVTLRVLVQVVYGEEVLEKYFQRILEVNDLLQNAVNLFNVGETRLPFYSYLPSKVNKTARSFNQAWETFNRFLFDEYEEGRLRSGDGLFFSMMEQLKTHARDLREQELLHSVDEILLLNIDVSFAATSFALADLARYASVQEKLRREVDEILLGADPSSCPDLDNKLPYMEMVLKESARMNPALALSLPERTVKPVTDIGGYQIPKGTPVCVDTQSLNFSEKYWKDPDKFDPDRFANGARPVPGSLFRFGMGPRKCLGYRYALAITRIVVASVLQRYTLQLANPEVTARVKTKGMTFFTPYLCPEMIFNERG